MSVFYGSQSEPESQFYFISKGWASFPSYFSYTVILRYKTHFHFREVCNLLEVVPGTKYALAES